MHSNKDTDTFYIGPDYCMRLTAPRLRRFGHYFYDAGTDMIQQKTGDAFAVGVLLAGCSTPPQTIKTPPDAVYLLDRGDEVNIAVSGNRISLCG